jgi:hypothetical protein
MVSLLFSKSSASSNHKGMRDKCKSNRVVVGLRIGYDFSMEGEISLGGVTMLTKVIGIHPQGVRPKALVQI